MQSTIQTPYGKSKVYEAGPNLANAPRVLIFPGYSETTTHSKSLVNALGAAGFDAAAFSQPRRSGDAAHRVKDPLERQGKVIQSQIEAFVPEGEKANVVAHSQAAAGVLKAALANPDRFESITLMEPIGLVGDQSFPELLGRVGKKTAKNLAGAVRGQDPNRQPEHGYAARVDTESGAHYFGRVAVAQLAGTGVIGKQPRLALSEAIADGHYDHTIEVVNEDGNGTHTEDEIALVRELGIPVNVVSAPNDEMFDQAKVDAHMEGIGLDGVTSYSSIADREARHDTFWMQPERTAKIIGQFIRETYIPEVHDHDLSA